MATHFDMGYRLYQRRWLAAALWEFGQHLPSARRQPAEVARTFNAMATCLLAQGEAHRAYVKAELARDAASQLISGHPQIFYAHLNGALASLRSGDISTARWLSETALQISHGTKLPEGRIAQVMGTLAVIAVESEQYDVASAWIEKAVELAAGEDRWLVQGDVAANLGICLAERGEADKSELFFERALALLKGVPEATNVYVERGWARVKRGDIGGAVADAAEIVDELLARPAHLAMLNAADGLMLLSVLARIRGEDEIASRLYVQAFAWMATVGRRAHLRRSTRAADGVPNHNARFTLPDWRALVRLTETLTAGEHRGPAPAQRFGRSVHGVHPQFATRAGRDTLASAAVYLRLPTEDRGPATLPAKTLVNRFERGRKGYDTAVLSLLDWYDRALVEEGHPYPAVLDRMTRGTGAPWDPRAVRRLLLAHAS